MSLKNSIFDSDFWSNKTFIYNGSFSVEAKVVVNKL